MRERWHAIWLRLRTLITRRRLDRDLADEMAFHLHMRAEDARRRGLAPADAAAASRRQFGNPTALRETSRELWTFRWIESFSRDIRLGLRLLMRQPGFTAVAVLTLALGIGATSAIFSFVDGVLLRPLPYPEANRIVLLWEKPPGGLRNGISALNFLDWQTSSTSFSSLTATTVRPMTLGGIDEPTRLRVARVSPSYFDTYGIHPLFGPGFQPDEDQPGRDHVVVLQHKVWVSQFGADSTLPGRAITLDGEAYTVVGVMPDNSPFERGFTQAWRPIAFTPGERTRDFHWLLAVGRLRPGVTIERAQAEMTAIGARIAQQYPDSNKGWSVFVEPFGDQVVSTSLSQGLYVLFGAVAMLLLIGCVNLANLTLARGLARAREVAVRAALGAGRRRLVRQFVTENVVLSLLGGAAGVALGYALMEALRQLLPPGALPREALVAMDGRVLAFAFLVSVSTGVCFGLAPALQATKSDLTATMKEGARGGTSDRGRRRVRAALVITEIALAFVLVAGAGLLVRSLTTLLHEDPGFDDRNVLTMTLPHAGPADAAHLVPYVEDLLAHVQAAPGVTSAALADTLPLQGWGNGMPYQVAGRAAVDRANRQATGFKRVSPAYFQTLGMRVIKGRGLSVEDRSGTPPVTVINKTMAEAVFPGQNPLGQHLLIQQIAPDQPQLGPELPWEVIGVVADENTQGLDQPPSGGMYVPLAQSPYPSLSLVVRSAVRPEAVETAVRQAVHAVDKRLAIADVRLLADLRRESTAQPRLQTALLAAFAALALTVAAIGIYGVMSYSVAQRTREIGIRTALGASGGSVLGMVLGDGLRLVAIGLTLGLGGALALARLLTALLFGVTPGDPEAMAFTLAVLGLVALAACFIPARRAMRLDPLAALRAE